MQKLASAASTGQDNNDGKEGGEDDLGDLGALCVAIVAEFFPGDAKGSVVSESKPNSTQSNTNADDQDIHTADDGNEDTS